MLLTGWLKTWNSKRRNLVGGAGSLTARTAPSRTKQARRRRTQPAAITAIELCEPRILLSVTPVVSLSQAQTNADSAQTAYDNAVSNYNTTTDSIVSDYDNNVQGHWDDYFNNTVTLTDAYGSAVDGIWTLHTTSVESFASGFQSALSGFQATLDTNNALAESTYNSEVTAHSNTYTSAVAGIESGYNSTVDGADSLLDSSYTLADQQFTDTESNESDDYDSALALADSNYSGAVAGHESWLESQEASAFALYDAAAGDNPTGALGLYNATETFEAAARDSTLSSYPNTTYDPLIVGIDFDLEWGNALATVQPALTTAETDYGNAVDSAVTAYESSIDTASTTYDTLVAAADIARDTAYATADTLYDTNAGSGQNDYDVAVNGPGGIEEIWQNAIDAADSAYTTAVDTATAIYNSTVQSAQSILDAAKTGADQEFDDWLNGNLPGQTLTATFRRTKIVDSSSSPATVTWKSSASLGWNPTETTAFESERKFEPKIPAGYVLVSTTISTAGLVTTTIEDYAAPASGIGTGNAGVTLTPEHNNPWELAQVARTEFYVSELDEYYAQYLVAETTAQISYDSAVAAANTTYYTSLYGNAEGVAPYGAGTPADAWTSAVDGANTTFTTGEQAAHATYDMAMQVYNLAHMQYEEDALNGLSTIPPDPDDPLRAAKDYAVDVAALDVNHASAVGGAWVGWVSAERAADTLRDDATINAEYQRDKGLNDAGRTLADQQVAAEDAYAGDMIDIGADYAIAKLTKRAEIAGDVADAEESFELAQHAAGAFAAQATNLAGKNREDSHAVADETRSKALSLENENLSNDLAAEEETRQNSHATADAAWMLDEAGAEIAATAIAAPAASLVITSLVSAEFGFLTAAAPLITTATQTFSNAIDAAYTAYHPGDPNQTAVSAAWTAYYNNTTTAAQSAITSESSAYQTYASTMAGALQTTMINVATEAITIATDYGTASTSYVSTVGSAATMYTSQAANAEVAWTNTVATAGKNAVQNSTSAWLTMANDDVQSAKDLADDTSGYRNDFVHDTLGAVVPHETNLINADRQADQDFNAALTTLATGIIAEEFNRTNDELTEWKNASLAISPLDDIVVNAWATLDAAQSVLPAAQYYADTVAASLSDFYSVWSSGTAPMINHAFDLAGGNDDVVMAAAVASTGYPHWFSDYISRVFSWNPPQPSTNWVDGALTRGRQAAVVTAGISTVAIGGAAAAGVGSMTMAEIGATAATAAATASAEAYVVGTLTASSVTALVASSGSRVVTVFTRLSNSPARDRMLTAAQRVDLANAVGPGRQLFTGRIPHHLYQRLFLDNHIVHGTTEMNGVVGTEVQISAEAMAILQKYFQ